jgi:hypothetical protein
MISDISALTAWASFWDAVSVVSAGFVLLGVVGESVADFDRLAKWTKLDARPMLRDKVAKAGLLVLIGALAIEVVAAIGSHNTNADIIAVLDGELDQTIRHDIELTNLTKSLGFSNRALQDEVKGQSGLLKRTNGQIVSLSTQGRQIETAIGEQRKRDSTELAALKGEESKLEAAQREVSANAAKTASAAEAANKAQSDMTTALNDVQAMRERLKEIITPRQIDDAHFALMVVALKKFPKTSVELGLTRDPESAELMVRISDALVATTWDIKPCRGAGFGLRANARPNLPDMCDLTGRGVQVSVAQDDLKALEPAGDAFILALRNAGIFALGSTTPDKLPDGKPNPDAITHGVLRIIIGAKP